MAGVSSICRFLAYFTASKQGATGLTVTVDVWNPSGTEIVTAGSATEVGDGMYAYELAESLFTVEGTYAAVFKTSSTSVDTQHIPAAWESWTRFVDSALSDMASDVSALRGAGSASRTIKIVDGDTTPIVGAEVWVSNTSDPVSPSNPTNLIAGPLSTDDNGNVSFMLDPGTTVYVWCDDPRASFTNPTTWEVT